MQNLDVFFFWTRGGWRPFEFFDYSSHFTNRGNNHLSCLCLLTCFWLLSICLVMWHLCSLIETPFSMMRITGEVGTIICTRGIFRVSELLSITSYMLTRIKMYRVTYLVLNFEKKKRSSSTGMVYEAANLKKKHAGISSWNLIVSDIDESFDIYKF